jgi:hypothetical protein
MTMRFHSFLLLCWILCFGATMPVFAGPAHPSGPEGRPFIERTIRIQGKTQNVFLSLAHPKTDPIGTTNGTLDFAPDGFIDAATNRPRFLMLRFSYQGFFWQGVFGSVGLDVVIRTRKPDTASWKTLDDLMQWRRSTQLESNEASKNESSKSRQEYSDPVISELNGTPCVQQYLSHGEEKNAESRHYFPIDEDHAVEVTIKLVDNSDRPGLTESDWRPCAEAFAAKLLATVRVRTGPFDPPPY